MKLLSGYRVVELGEPAAMVAGKVLGDMGADVIRVIPSGGDPWREKPPLVRWGEEEVSAQWLAYNTSKRTASLALDTGEGRAVFERLVDRADLVLAAGQPGDLAARKLLPADLRASRRKLVAAAITPFGLTGPRRDWLASDLVLEAAGGMLFLNGDADRPPVRITEEMAWAQAGTQASYVAMAALYCAQKDGLGESIDLSMQEVIVEALVDALPWAKIEKRDKTRNAKSRQGRNIEVPIVWRCKDGYVCYRLSFGRGIGKRNLYLTNWMASEGMDDGLLEVEWENVSTLTMRQEEADSWVRRIGRFFLTKTRAELYAGARERHMLLFPVAELADVLGSEQLAARGFFVPLTDPSGRRVLFPGALFRTGDDCAPFPSPPPVPGQTGVELTA